MTDVRLTIDGREIEAHAGTTILHAARAAGTDIPTLCHREGLEPNVSCFVCAVEVEGRDALQPACVAPVEDGMVVHTDTDEARDARRTALELLFSDHAGMCVAPCSLACPADVEVADFIAALTDGRPRDAVAVLKRRIPFPVTLGRICPAFCEKPCLRRHVDEPIAVAPLHEAAGRHPDAADWSPERAPDTGRRVAVVGAGPAGMTAAWFLLRAGHAVAVLDAADRPGGRLRQIGAGRLPTALLDEEIAPLTGLGVEWRFGHAIETADAFEALRREADAVVIASGAWARDGDDERVPDAALFERWGLETKRGRLSIDAATGRTPQPDVFAAGEATLGATNMVRCVAAGRRAAVAVDQFLRGEEVVGPPRPYHFMAPPNEAERERLQADHPRAPRVKPAGDNGLSSDETAREADRCLQCDCEKKNDCHLRELGAALGAGAHRFRGERRELDPDETHPDIRYEPGKCILCGRCLALAAAEGEPRGLALIGRGFPTRVGGALGADANEALTRAAHLAAEACPTAALTLRRKP